MKLFFSLVLASFLLTACSQSDSKQVDAVPAVPTPAPTVTVTVAPAVESPAADSEAEVEVDEGPVSVTQMVGTVNSWSRSGSSGVEVDFTVTNEGDEAQSVLGAGCFISAFDSRSGNYYGKQVFITSRQQITLNPGESFSNKVSVVVNNLQTGSRGGSEFIDSVFVNCD